MPDVSYGSYFLIHFFLFLFGLGTAWLLRQYLGVTLLTGLISTLLILSILSLFLGRIWTFISPTEAAVAYEELEGDFYEDSSKTAQVGSFRAWYHNGRWKLTRDLVDSVFHPGSVIYDFGSGGSEWNANHLPVIGVDANRQLLEHGVSTGKLESFVVSELWNAPVPDESADIVVITEVLEHVLHPAKVLENIRRILKTNGALIATVPWDSVFSPFLWFFKAQCFYRGYVLGEKYYRLRCGHIQHFTKRKLQALLLKCGFSVEKLYRFRSFLLVAICKK